MGNGMSGDLRKDSIPPHEARVRDILVHLKQALEAADEAGLPLEIPARIQEVIDACEALNSSSDPPHGRPN